MNRGLGLAGTFGLGAGVAYFLDPQTGRRRRALFWDRLVGATHTARDAADCAARDISHRAYGLAAEARSLAAGDGVGDVQLEERVRSKMGRAVSHPGSIEVMAREGRVTLGGPVLAQEVDRLLSTVSSVKGVTGVENRLEVHREPGNVPGLQGGKRRRPAPAFDMLQTNWSPATRTLAGTAGGALLAWGLTQRFPVACALGTAGIALAARSLTNQDFGRLAGVAGGRSAVEVHKTITVAAPVESVFSTFANYETFPRFMRNIREVRDLGGGRSHWVAAGPAGAPVSWDAVVTRIDPNEVLAWRSEPGSTVANAGFIRFEPSGDGGTRVDIRLLYNPPGGAIGHAAAALFGADPKSEMDEDLVRLKSLIEDGTTSVPGEGVTSREKVAAGAGDTTTPPPIAGM